MMLRRKSIDRTGHRWRRRIGRDRTAFLADFGCGLLPGRKRRRIDETRTGRETRPTGFTLLEVLLALTLSVVLLGAIFTAMEQTWRLTASGREEMERSQLARALLRKIALDVRSIAFVPPPVTDDTATGSTTGTSGTSSATTGSSSSSGSTGSATSATGTSTTSTGSSTTDEEPTAKSIGIRGNAQRVEMHVTRARRDLEFSAKVDGNKLQTHTSDLRVLTYQLGATGGLMRTDGDRLATLMVEEKGGAATALSAQQVLAPEVSFLQFRFFDGVAWFTTWDSESSGRLPRALEVTIGFAPPKTRPGPLFRVGVSASANQFRTVILLPISDPLPQEYAP